MTRTGASPRPAARTDAPERVAVTLRPYPYPYRAMLAVCSDLDETPDHTTYREIVRFLNTSASTAMGAGVGLEVGNSVFFMSRTGEFSYFGTDEAGREMLRALMRSGHVDCLHSYGDLATRRADAERVLGELTRHDCRLQVWVDHSKAPSNFGPDIMCGRGDLPGEEVYHADLAVSYGIRYVWRGRTSGIAGQDAPIDLRSLSTLLRIGHPVRSTRTIATQLAKVVLGARGHPRWTMYAENAVCRVDRLRDGQPVWEFLRSNPHWGGTGAGATADGVGAVLTERFLDLLVRRGATCVLYTHLGKVRDIRRPFGTATVQAFRRLAARQHAGDILVTTTQRLLQYATVRRSLRYEASREGGRVMVVVRAIDDPVLGTTAPSAHALIGITFTVERCDEAAVRLASGDPVPVSLTHEDRVTHVTVPWQRLTLPAI